MQILIMSQAGKLSCLLAYLLLLLYHICCSADQKLLAVSLLDNTVKVFFADTCKVWSVVKFRTLFLLVVFTEKLFAVLKAAHAFLR